MIENRKKKYSENGELRMLDLHAHLFCLGEENRNLTGQEKRELAEEELKLRRENGILTCFSSGTPQEWNFMEQFAHREEVLLSFGIHPWYADQFQPEECREELEHCRVIGEIGMDSVWCQVPLELQQRNLEKQLELAAEWKKPVILHTKGQEERIAELIRGFPQPICVHWYSGNREGFEQFLEEGCYFTLGPDAALMETGILEPDANFYGLIPQNRVFPETDGISAVAWAFGAERMPLTKIPSVLEGTMKYYAKQKGMYPEVLRQQMWENFRRFLSIKDRADTYSDTRRIPLMSESIIME